MIFASVLIVIVALTSSTTGQSVTQSPSHLVIKEGAVVFINCTYQYSGSVYPFWYIQQSNREPPQLLLTAYTGQVNGFFAKHLGTAKSFHLQKEASDINDSATYFCAVRDASFGSYRLVFGDGTHLKVNPDLEDSEPSLYELKPQKQEDQSISACLITDYSPGNISAGLEYPLDPVNSSVVVNGGGSDSTASYGTVLWGNNDGNFNCHAFHEGKNYSLNDAEDAEDECSAVEFETDERLNFLSVTVLGLRFIFLKSVAVNLLLTFRLWSS